MITSDRSPEPQGSLPDGGDPERFDPDRLDVYFRRQSEGGTPLYGGLLALIALACAAIPTVQVPISIRAEGHLRARAETVSVVAPANGWARWVRSPDSRKVRAGDTLLLLDRPGLEARLSTLRTRELRLESEIDDLRMLRSHPIDAVEVPSLRSLRYDSDWQHVRAQMSRLEERLAAALGQQQGRVDAGDAGRASFAEARSLGRLVRELQAQRELVRAVARSRWRRELADAEVRLQALRDEEATLREQQKKQAILSPATGDLDEMSGYVPGMFVRAGAPVAKVTPASELIAELQVEPDDLPSLSHGSPVRLQIGSGRSSAPGFIQGRVYEVAPLAAGLGRRALARARVALDPPRGIEGEDHLRFQRGLSVSARIPAGRRTLLDLLRARPGPSRGRATVFRRTDEPAS